MRFLQACAGAVLFLIGIGIARSALDATDAESKLPSVAKTLVLTLAAGGLACTAAGLLVGLRGFSDRSWILFGTTITLYLLAYATALGVAEVL